MTWAAPERLGNSNSDNLLFLGPRSGQGKFAHEDLRLARVDGPKLHSSGAQLVAAMIPRDKEINAAGLGSKVGSSGGQTSGNSDERLPISTEMMLAWLDRT